MTTTLHAAHALTADGWRHDVRLSIEAGRISAMHAEAPPATGDERVDLLLPGMPNLHSHAFQRGMAGLVEHRGGSDDSFWTWRDLMYRHALAVTPDQVEAIAAQLYVEMLEAGFTRVGEFHYLHHDRDGGRYSNIAEMAERIAAAAGTTGIALTLLPVLYVSGSLGGAPPAPGQRRFVTPLDDFARLLDGSRAVVAGLDGANVGIAPHSLRAVPPHAMREVAALSAGGPVHIHAAEQVKEVEDCLAWSGKRPIEWLLDNVTLDARWCVVHATHMTSDETVRLASSGATAGLCPITEANLGDGIFNGVEFLKAGGALGIGSDQNVLIGVADELRQLEYSQRLRHRARNVLAPPGSSTGEALFGAAIKGGASALGQPPAGIRIGARADLVSLDTTGPAFAGRGVERYLDCWIFATRSAVDRVWAGGTRLVEAGRHIHRDAIAARFARVMREMAEL